MIEVDDALYALRDAACASFFTQGGVQVSHYLRLAKSSHLIFDFASPILWTERNSFGVLAGLVASSCLHPSQVANDERAVLVWEGIQKKDGRLFDVMASLLYVQYFEYWKNPPPKSQFRNNCYEMASSQVKRQVGNSSYSDLVLDLQDELLYGPKIRSSSSISNLVTERFEKHQLNLISEFALSNEALSFAKLLDSGIYTAS